MPREEVKVPGGPAPVRRASLPSRRSMVPGHSLCCWNANEVRSPHPPHAGMSDRFFCDVWMQNVYPANRRQPCRRIHRESRRARPRGLSRLRPVFRYERCCLHRGPLQFRSQLQRRPKYAQRCHDPSIAFGTSAGDIHAAVETDALVRHDEPAPGLCRPHWARCRRFVYIDSARPRWRSPPGHYLWIAHLFFVFVQM
jgi:hypothetical protein